eukprot:Lithocolla_globosa_v1_NODE_369_length_4280_cov_26.823000.p8 type:complete len:106 gc:universal NODE_369_length_4280_cov_26.823000:2016-1699(-)
MPMDWEKVEEEDFTFEQLTNDNFVECGDLWVQVMSEREPITAHLNQSGKLSPLTTIFKYAFAECIGNSLVARDKKTGKLAAFRLAKDFAEGYTWQASIFGKVCLL